MLESVTRDARMRVRRCVMRREKDVDVGVTGDDDTIYRERDTTTTTMKTTIEVPSMLASLLTNS